MKKVYVIIFFCIVFVAISAVLGYYFFKLTVADEPQGSVTIGLEKIEDECTQEGKSLKIENTVVQANAEEKKVSPNAALIIKKYYPECGHTTKDYAEIPQELVNLNEKEVAQYYKDWELKGFSNNEIVLYKEMSGICNEHYILKAEDGVIVIYTVDKDNKETLKERMQISTEYLTEEDLEKLVEGIKIFGKEDLNATIEDFE